VDAARLHKHEAHAPPLLARVIGREMTFESFRGSERKRSSASTPSSLPRSTRWTRRRLMPSLRASSRVLSSSGVLFAGCQRLGTEAVLT